MIWNNDVVSEQDLVPGVLYLVLKPPKGIFDKLYSFAGLECSSISYCIDGVWVRFSQPARKVILSPLDQRDGFRFIATPYDASANDLLSIVDSEWSLKNNCVTVWSSIWYDSPMAHRRWEILPSQYAARMIKQINE